MGDDLELVVVRGTYGVDLYEVTRETEQRLYGRRIEGSAYTGKCADKNKVIARRVTARQFAQLKSLLTRVQARRTKFLNDLTAWERKKTAAIFAAQFPASGVEGEQ